DRPAEPARRLAAGGEQGHAVAVRVGVDQLDRVVQRVGADDHQDRPEDFVGVDVHAGRDVVEQARPDVEPVAGGVPAVYHQVSAGFDAAADVGDDPVAGGGGDDRAHLAVRVAAGTDAQDAGLTGEAGHQLVAGVADRHDGGDGH